MSSVETTTGVEPEIIHLLATGLTPSRIAQQLKRSIDDVIREIRVRVGEGELQFSEIYFNLSDDKREAVNVADDEEKACGTPDTNRLGNKELSLEDFTFYQSIRQRHVFAGDLYVHISESELSIHDFVFDALKRRFGTGEAGYWREGVPLPVRQRCQAWREEDIFAPREPFQYTTLIDLSTIITKQWGVFAAIVPDEYKTSKRNLAADLARLNSIRNTVMHPVQRRRWSEDDFAFARRIHAAFQIFRK